MEFHISRAELQTLFLVGRSTSYKLHASTETATLSRPVTWCGKKKVVFCLRVACVELAKLNGLEPPSEATIKEYWSNILMLRQEKGLRSNKK